MPRKPASRLFARVAFIIIAVLILHSLYRSGGPDTGENVPRVSWLPESASNVSYYRSATFTAYEFDIPEADFLAWAKSQNLDLHPIDPAAPPTLRRYLTGRASTTTTAPATAPASPTITIRQGHLHTRRQGKDMSLVAYDTTTGRAYVEVGAAKGN